MSCQRLFSYDARQIQLKIFTILDPDQLINEALICELCQKWCDYIHATVKDDQRVDLV